MTNLKKGSKGNEVKKWQTFLTVQGFDTGGIDGDFGMKTHNATIKFQTANGLDADGVVGKNTLAKAVELGFDAVIPKTGTTKFDELKSEYEELYATCEIKSGKQAEVNGIVTKIRANEQKYKDAAEPLGIPWQFVAAIHSLEASLNFTKHLHNGDSLQKRTVKVPKGRPVDGTPPFTWEESTMDALIFKNLDKWNEWSIAGILFKLEEYNGMGYRNNHPKVLSPYLWSYTNKYTSGKYVADGEWSDTAVSQQCGAVAILKMIYNEEVVQPVKDEDVTTPTASGESSGLISAEDVSYKWIKDELIITKDYKKGDKGKQVKLIQEWLIYHDFRLVADSDYGPVTEKVIKEFQIYKGLEADGVVNKETFNELIKPALRVLTPIEAGDKSYGELVAAYAEQHLKEHPVEIGGNNRGPWVRMYMKGQEGSDWAWCAGFATFILRQAADNSKFKMPIETTFGCDELANDSKENGLFVEGKKLINGSVDYNDMPIGSIFLVRKVPGDWTHTGIVIEFDSDSVKTIEGNTNDEGSREGYEVCTSNRGYKNLDFVKVE